MSGEDVGRAQATQEGVGEVTLNVQVEEHSGLLIVAANFLRAAKRGELPIELQVKRFPGFKDQVIKAGMRDRLASYKQRGFKVVICENQGGVDAGYRSLGSCEAEFTELMMLLPEVDECLVCPDMQGNFLIWFFRVPGELLPSFVRFSLLMPNSHAHLPITLCPNGEQWLATLFGFDKLRKPNIGMLELAALGRTPNWKGEFAQSNVKRFQYLLYVHTSRPDIPEDREAWERFCQKHPNPKTENFKSIDVAHWLIEEPDRLLRREQQPMQSTLELP